MNTEMVHVSQIILKIKTEFHVSQIILKTKYFQKWNMWHWCVILAIESEAGESQVASAI